MMKRILAVLLSLLMLMSCALAEADVMPVGAENASEAVVSGDENTLGETTDVMGGLIEMIAGALMDQEYTLDILTEYSSQTVRASSADGKTIQLEIEDSEMDPIRIQLDSTSISSLDDEESYAYAEFLDMLIFGTAGDGVAAQAASWAEMLDEYDLDFLGTVGELAYYELMKAGAIPAVKYIEGETRFTMSITPDLIMTAAVRLIEQVLTEHQVEMDALLAHTEPMLRMLAPDIFEEYDSETGTYVQRGGYTCAELQELFGEWITDEWLSYGSNFVGMNLNISGSFGRAGWQVEAEYFMPDSDISCWFTLSGNEDGSLEGAIEYFVEDYSSVTQRYEPQVFRFNIDGEIRNRRFSLRVRPETPVTDFTGLKISYMMDPSGWVVDAVTDLLDFRMEASDQFVDISAVMEELLAEVHLSWFGGVPQGSLVYQDYYDGVYIKLNKAE